MNAEHPSDVPPRQCRARNRQGNQCKRRPVPGALVCKMHGGAAPQVQRSARQRLLEAADPVAARLIEIALSTSDENVAIRAGQLVLDRAGHAPGVKVGQLEDDASVNEEIEKLLGATRGDQSA